MALKRWYELDSEGAHREIVAQIGSASPSLAAQSIAFLPEEQFPQFEPIWAQALLDTTSQLRERALGSLLVRFGTGAATNQMIAKLEANRSYPCDAHVVALAYLAKFNPKLARKRLKHEVETNEGKCGADLLRWISEFTVAPVINDVAVENLNSPDPETLIDAVRYLTPYGRKKDEAPLWRRYVEWTSAYDGKTNLLDKSGPSNWDKNFASSIIGEELGSALIRGQGWFADPELIESVLKKCVGESMCKRLKDDTHSATGPYQLNLPDSVMQSVGKWLMIISAWRSMEPVRSYFSRQKSVNFLRDRSSFCPAGIAHPTATSETRSGGLDDIWRSTVCPLRFRRIEVVVVLPMVRPPALRLEHDRPCS